VTLPTVFVVSVVAQPALEGALGVPACESSRSEVLTSTSGQAHPFGGVQRAAAEFGQRSYTFVFEFGDWSRVLPPEVVRTRWISQARALLPARRSRRR